MDGKREVLSAEDLARSVEVVRRAFTRETLQGLESLAAQVLVLLVAEPGLSVKQCAERLSAGQSNVSTAIKGLEARKLVRRQPSKADPRTHSIAVTASGLRLARTFVEAASK